MAVSAGVEALLLYLLAWLLATAAFRGRRGRLEVSPVAVLLRFRAQLGPWRGRLARGVSLAGYASVALAYLVMGLFYYLMLATFWVKYVARPPGASGLGVVPLIPGVTVPLSVLPHVLIALGIAAALHELAHAVAARAEGLSVKNVGLALFIFVPAAFVELDEEELARAPLASKLKVYSAGVTANVILYLLFLGLAGALPCTTLSHGVSVISVAPNSPAANATIAGLPGHGLQKGDVIIGVNGVRVYCIKQLAAAFERAGVKEPGRAVNLTLYIIRNGKPYTVYIYKPANHTLIGITIIDKYTTAGLLVYSSIMLNLALALINAGPLFITDGAKMLDEPLSKLAGQQGRLVSAGIQAATLLLIFSLLTLKPILPG
ncbi:MAG: site-2 protease family protein [Desulfurococcales archaeon]|nr:site-2 protease family protein [Desulfurococcales archaeon]